MTTLIDKWWPRRPNREEWSERLSSFYAENSAYHAITARGFLVGSHTHTHPILKSLDEASQRREIEISRGILADITGEIPHLLAYPVGGPAAFSATTMRIARELGFKLGFSYYGGLVFQDHRRWLDIPRLPVDHESSFACWRTNLVLECFRRG
jgi:peptidoglycan/xylan/chitin deacetylase (PgdA/CDA1 family)